MTDLRLYVWEGVLTDYTDGIMFALAESEEQAKELIVADAHHGLETVKDDLDKVSPRVVAEPEGFVLWGCG